MQPQRSELCRNVMTGIHIAARLKIEQTFVSSRPLKIMKSGRAAGLGGQEPQRETGPKQAMPQFGPRHATISN